MATLAHCAYCFECLSARLEHRKPLELLQVEILWGKYQSEVSGECDGGESTEYEKDEVELEMEDQYDLLPVEHYRPAAVSRLLAPSTTIRSSASTPSSASSASIQTNLSSNTSVSSASSSHLYPRRQLPELSSTPFPDSPLFVTWNTLGRSGHKTLRGCIGTFEPQKLEEGLRSYALTSAFDDSRFQPIHLRELPNLEVAVTLLTDFETAANPMAWELGRHGLRINFTHSGRRYGATYLPDVPSEQGWSKEETMTSLMRKAGWNGRRDDWRRMGTDLSVVRYQGRKACMGYREWRDWRDWVAGRE